MRPFLMAAFVMLFLCPFVIAAQQNPLNVQITPPGPEAASLGKFIDIPVSPYTGIPKVEIPVYQLKSYELSLPITLKYHASGVRMEELASFVGAGWSLDAGGIVSRTIRGLGDELPYQGYLSQSAFGNFSVGSFFTATGGWNNNFFNNNVLTLNAGNCNGDMDDEYSSILFASRGGLDLEPDLFFFSLPDGQSGKFVFSRNMDINFIPKQYVNIDYEIGMGGTQFTEWTIVGKDGTRYLFSAVETSENNSLCPEPSGIDVEQGQPNIPENIDAPTAWRNSMIISASGTDTIFFEYEGEMLSYEIANSATTYGYYSGNYPVPAPSYCPSQLVVGNQRLKKIRCSAGYEVEFVSNTSRSDIDGGHKLDKIIVRYKTQEFKAFDLTHTYAGGGSGFDEKMLLLTGIQEKQNQSYALPPYEFTYYPELISGFKRSNPNVDHWGFSNGETKNFYKTPSLIYGNTFYLGDNREPDLNYARQWALQKIEYPTGGTSVFEYELNDYSNIPATPPTFLHPHLEELTSIEFIITSDINANYSDTENFTLTTPTDVIFVYDIPQIPGGGIPASGCGGQLTCPSPSYLRNFLQPGGSVQTIEVLPAGSYTLTAEFDPSQFNWQGTDISTLKFYIKVYKVNLPEDLVENNSLKGGGLRIKKITSTGDNALTKTYHYTTPGSNISSGKLMTFPAYAYFMNFNDGAMQIGSCLINAEGTLIARTATSNLPLTLTQGSHVGYDVVTEYHGTPESNNGYTIYRYENHPDEESDQPRFPIVPQQSYAYKNGLLTEQTDYTATGKKVKHVINTYRFLAQETVSLGVKIAQDLQTGCNFCPNRRFGAALYGHFTERVELEGTLTRVFDTNNDNYQERSSYFYYDAYDQLSYSEETSSVPGKKLYKKFEYHPVDHTAITKKSSYYASSVNGPFEYMNGQLVGYNSFLKPNAVSILEPPQGEVASESVNYVQRLTYTHFDSRGNVISYLRDGIEETRNSIIWGYGGIFPTAQVVNALPGEIAYTSFETPGKDGGWTYNGTLFPAAMTGQKSYSILPPSPVLTDNKQLAAGAYILSYWTNSSFISVTYSDDAPVTQSDYIPPQVQGSWTLYTKKLTITGSARELKISTQGLGVNLDELRLYPIDAQITTYSYDPTKGVINIADPNNYITHYKYDERNRLKFVKDFEQNILKRFEYHYKKDN